MPASAVSQTPRLEANKMRSPMMGPSEAPTFKRAASALDFDYDLMGLSQHRALDDDFFLEQGNPMAAFDEVHAPPLHKDSFQTTFEQGFHGQDNLLFDQEVPPVEFPDIGLSLRNRSLTFNFPSNTADLIANLVDSKQVGVRQQGSFVDSPGNFDFNEQNNL